MKIITNFETKPVDIWNYQGRTGKDVEAEGIGVFKKTIGFVDGLSMSSTTEMPLELGIFHPHPDAPFIMDFTDGSFDKELQIDVSYHKTERGPMYKMSVHTAGTLWIYMMGKSSVFWLGMFVDKLLAEQGVEFKKNGADYVFPDDTKFSVHAVYANGQGYYYENFVFTFDYDDLFFRKALPDPFYGRKTGMGISGIRNRYPKFDVNKFVEGLIADADRV